MRDPFYIGALEDVRVQLTEEGKIDWGYLAQELAKYEDGSWVAMPKADGMWVRVRMNQGPNEIVSRNGKAKADDSVNGLLEVVIPQTGTLLVGELGAATEWATQEYERRGYRQIYLFDIAENPQGENLYETRSWIHRYELLMTWWTLWPKAIQRRLPLVPIWRENFLAHFKEELETKRFGGEGIMLWKKDLRIEGKIRSDGKVSSLVKVKGVKDKSYVLIGINRTKIGNSLTGAWGLFDENNKLNFVMQAGLPNNPTEEEAKSWIGRVADYFGFEVFSSGALRSARFLKWREDLCPEECKKPVR